MSSILKNNRSNERLGLIWLKNVLMPEALDDIKTMAVGSTLEYRHFFVQRDSSSWLVSPTLTPAMSNTLSQWLPLFDTDDSLAWVEMQAPCRIVLTKHVDNSMLRALYCDVLWIRGVHLMQRYPELSNSFVHYLEASTQWIPTNVTNDRTYKRASFLEINKMALFYDKDSGIIQRPQQVKRIKSLVDAIPSLRSLEVQEGFDHEKLSTLLEDMQKTLSKLNIPDNNRFDLRFRKIRRTRKTGMYIRALHLLIVDPRTTQSLWHELAHWIDDIDGLEIAWDGVVDLDIQERYPKARWDVEMRARVIEQQIIMSEYVLK